MNGSKQMEGIGIVLTRVSKDVAFEIPDRAIEVIDEFEIGRDTHANIGIFELFGDTLAMNFIGDLLAELGEVVLAVGVLDVAKEIGAFSHQVGTPAHEIPGGAHGSGIDVGLRDHACAKESADFLRIDSVVLGFTSMDGFHVEGVAEDEGDVFAIAEISEPVPGEHALDGYDDTVTEWTDGA